MTCTQMGLIVHLGYAAVAFELHHTLLVETLTAAGNDQRLTACFG